MTYNKMNLTEVVNSSSEEGNIAQLTLIDDKVVFMIGNDGYEFKINFLERKIKKHLDKIDKQELKKHLEKLK